VAREIGATFTVSENPKEHIKKQLQGISHLVHQNTPETLSTQIAIALFQLPSSARGSLPMTLSHSDLVLEPLRLRKDAGEQRALRLAASVTEQSLVGALRALRPGVTESSLAHEIDLGFAAFGGTTAFPTIVGTGPSAAALHHSPGKRCVGREDLVLIDCGAELDLYCADMTRTFPAAGRFSKTQRELYQAVLAAQTASLRSIRSGVTVTKVYDAAAEILIDFLIAKKIVKGSAKTVKKKGLFKPFFPHGIGHSLGLDVHDLGQLRPNTSARLESGMVFTVEPGLYFQKAVRGIAPCGIRIEDAVIVTPSGCKVLTPHVPKEPEEIEDLLAELDANAQR
jgi:Xaa-Pro aminopeptidase